MTTALRLDTTAESIDTRLFGTLTVTPADLLHFGDGIPGFPDAQRFVLLNTAAAALDWLQSVDDPALAFLLVDYTRVGAAPLPVEGATAHAIVTLPMADRAATVNLRAPVLIDPVNRKGKQAILTDSTHGTAEPLDLESLMLEPRPARS